MRYCTLDELEAFALAKNPGSSLVYFVAHNVSKYDGLDLHCHGAVPPIMRRVVNTIRRLYNQGDVDSVQRRFDYTTEYLAIKRRRPALIDALAHLPVCA